MCSRCEAPAGSGRVAGAAGSAEPKGSNILGGRLAAALEVGIGKERLSLGARKSLLLLGIPQSGCKSLEGAAAFMPLHLCWGVARAALKGLEKGWFFLRVGSCF